MDISGEIPRYQEENPYNYTALQLAKRKKAMLDMKKDYPNLPEAWLEMVYDYHENTDVEEVERIISEGEWESVGKFSNDMGGVLKCGVIEDK